MEHFDEWPAMQDFTFQEFSFIGNHYEMWEGGNKIRSGESKFVIRYTCNGEEQNCTTIDVSIFDNPISNILLSNQSFDRAICLGDRILLYITPAITNVQNTTLTMLSSIIGYTRDRKRYKSNEPVVASIFTINRSIVKVSFSLANPDRLIEIF